MNQLKYLVSAVAIFPFLPLMYLQGKNIRRKVPKLPEAGGPNGMEQIGAEKTIRLITIGESTIAGVGAPSHQEGFTGTLAKSLSEKLKVNTKWEVFAKSGYTAAKVKEQLIPKTKTSEADIIVIGLGGNDAFTLNSPAQWRKDINALIHEVKALFIDIPIVFINMPPIKSFPAFTPLIKLSIGNLVELLGNELEAITSNHENVYYYGRKITFDDWSERFGMENQPEKYFSDGVHPSLITYQIWAKDVADYIHKEVF